MLQELNEMLQPAEKQLHELVKRCNQVNRILEHAALEEDMEWKRPGRLPRADTPVPDAPGATDQERAL